LQGMRHLRIRMSLRCDQDGSGVNLKNWHPQLAGADGKEMRDVAKN